MGEDFVSSGAFFVSGMLGGFGFVFGLLVGSFLNVVIHRVPVGQSIAWPGSHCPACERPIRTWENIPLLSFLALRGRCAGCGISISWRYPAIEVLTGLLFLAVTLRFGVSAMTLVWMAFVAALVAAAMIDFDHQFIPDGISLGGLVLGLTAVPLVVSLDSGDLALAYSHAFLGALVGGGLLWIVGFVHARISVAMGREFSHWPGEGEDPPTPGDLDYWIWFPGMGFGDIKLLAMIGAFLGVWGVLETILLASLLGLLWGGIWAALQRNTRVPFGFGPAIAIAAILVVFLPRSLLDVLVIG